MTIVLTGTTGHLGSRVLNHILTLIPPSEIIVSLSTENPKVEEELKKRGVTVRIGNFRKPETLEDAFKGADKLFIVSVPRVQYEERVSAHTNAINAAKKAGIKHIYYTSLAIHPDSQAFVLAAHRDTEKLLKESGLIYTIIREGTYIESLPIYLGLFKRNDSEVAVPGNGKIPWVCWEDLAIGTAKIIASDSGEYNNQTVNLVGEELTDLEEATKILSTILKKEIKFVIVSEEEWISRHPGLKEVAVPWASTYPSLQKGHWEVHSPLLKQLLGRPIKSLKERVTERVQQEDVIGFGE